MHGNMSICITLEYREKAFCKTTLFIVERRAINPICSYRIVIDLSVVMLVKLTHSLTHLRTCGTIFDSKTMKLVCVLLNSF